MCLVSALPVENHRYLERWLIFYIDMVLCIKVPVFKVCKLSLFLFIKYIINNHSFLLTKFQQQ